ncbi:uncharacterized protein C12orf56 homolog isoform X2 [Lepisosteus oculatus]|uniref:uncharacterized protein C12orf56 homolog isoform X2 n=1 Tax=Lepisosteus oculatus TaxID=7918 RepID=UPI003717E8FE
MAGSYADRFPCPRNSRLDSFLKRHTERRVYEEIRAYEPCVVVSDTANKAFMYAVLGGDGVFLTDHPPRSVQEAVRFRDVRGIELVSDSPAFLRGRDRERAQHVRVVYAALNSGTETRRSCSPLLGGGSTSSGAVPTEKLGRRATAPHLRWGAAAGGGRTKQTRSASYPSSDLTGLGSRRASAEGAPGPPDPAPVCAPGTGGKEQRLKELHLYTLSASSLFYQHLRSTWDSYVIKSTLMLDPLYRRRSSLSSTPSAHGESLHSSERAGHLFNQLAGELLHDDNTQEQTYLLVQELKAAAQGNSSLKRLFWRSQELFPFLVTKLHDVSRESQAPYGGKGRPSRDDEMLLGILIVQTLAEVSRGMETEPARLRTLTAERGSSTQRLLMTLVCEPLTGNIPSLPDSRLTGTSPIPSPQGVEGLRTEFWEAAAALVYEVLVLSHQVCFIGDVAKQVVDALSSAHCPLLPAQAVLLYQRCYILHSCLQHSSAFADFIRAEYREEFRYYIQLSSAEDKLPPCYPITPPTLQLIRQVLLLVEHGSRQAPASGGDFGEARSEERRGSVLRGPLSHAHRGGHP